MKLILGDCLEKLKELPDNSVDTIITDPPYGLKFMGKKWDYDVPSVDIWKECLRVLKPGGYLLSFAGTRTQHRMAVNIEDAGFEIRDMIAWVYGSGFPKSLNIGKVMDKYLKTGNASWNGTGDSSNGALGYSKLQHNQGYRPADYSNKHQNKEEITEDLAKKWEGWGTALKPALEPITVARKPLEKGLNVASNCLKWGVGGINIDGCRVGTDTRTYKGMSSNKPEVGTFRDDNWKPKNIEVTATGRFPANLIHDGSEEVVGLFPNSKGASSQNNNSNGHIYRGQSLQESKTSLEGYRDWYNDNGSASRFFYCAKASKRERNKGLENMEKKAITNAKGNGLGRVCNICGANQLNPCNCKNNTWILPKKNQNNHPTVKPIALMEYLVKLVSREGQVVLDPFMGSGTTGMACVNTGRDFIGIEIDEDYFKIAQARIESCKESRQLTFE